MNRLAGVWRRQPGAIKTLVVALAAIALLNLVGALIGGGEEDEGEPSPLVTTDPVGFAAYAELLDGYGYPVDETLGPDSPLSGGTGTVVLLGGTNVGPEDTDALRGYMEDGGTVLLDAEEQGLIDALFEEAPQGTSPGPTSAAPLDGDDTGVAEVRADGEGAWATPGEAEPLLAGAGGDLLVEAEIGQGRAFLFADPSPLQNRFLAQADNARLGLELAGEDREPVTFGLSEEALGQAPEPEQGLSALPDEWIAALAGLLIAALLAMWARARRIGPPEDPDRELMPARGAYVDAVGSTLAQNGDRDAVAARLREVALTRLSRTTMVDLGSDPERLDQWLRARGLDAAEADALARGQANTKEEMMLAASGLAKLTVSVERSGMRTP